MGRSNTSMLQGVDARTQLVGHNRLELLLFRFAGKQRYGINVFKVREVINCPELTVIPNSHFAVCGITNMRGNTFMVIDLQMALGMGGVEDARDCSVIVTEYNRKMQGFLVPHIEHIINKHWEEVLPPPSIAGKDHYLTAVTHLDDELIEILDVEKVLFEITGVTLDDDDLRDTEEDGGVFADVASRCHILVADDSSVARKQIQRAISKLGVPCTICNDGKAALDTLQNWADNDAEEYRRLALVISDVEMPVMDGYTLTSNIRKDDRLKDLTILLHTSLSGVFDSQLLESVDANAFLSKFDKDELEEVIKKYVGEFSPKLNESGL